MENKQRPVIAETRELVQKYHVLEKAQIYAYFALDGRDHFVGKAFKALEKERQVFIHPELKNIFLLRRKSIRYGSYSTEREKSLIFCTFQRRKLRW